VNEVNDLGGHGSGKRIDLDDDPVSEPNRRVHDRGCSDVCVESNREIVDVTGDSVADCSLRSAWITGVDIELELSHPCHTVQDVPVCRELPQTGRDDSDIENSLGHVRVDQHLAVRVNDPNRRLINLGTSAW
jgi:hypothetical protein